MLFLTNSFVLGNRNCLLGKLHVHGSASVVDVLLKPDPGALENREKENVYTR